MPLPTKLPTNLKDLKPSKEQVAAKLGEVMTYARLALSGKPMISVKNEGDGAVSLTEGYFGNRTHIGGLRFEDLPGALEHRLISEDAAMEVFRYMVRHKILTPANDENYKNE